MKFSKRVLACAVAAGLVAPMSAMATNGYFSHGYGIKAKGMGGAGIAYGQDALAAATNPANMVLVGSRIDFGVDIFSPDRKTEVVGTPGGAADAQYDPNDDSIFVIPEFGYNHMINDTMSFGVSVFGNGGMNTSYKQPIAAFGGTTNAGVNLEQLFISPTYAVKAGDKHAFGIAVNLIYQTFEATGIQGFDNGTASSNPGSVTDKGKDTSTGFNVRLGWTGQLSDVVTLGATYQSKADMSEFEDYKGLFAEQGDFDIPETYGLGLLVKASDKINVAFDVTKINYSDVKSIGNPISNFATAQLGSDNGPGFGWEDVTVYKLGVDWKVSNSVVLRGGWNHSEQPIPVSETMFNLLAPGVVEDHLTAGATWTLKNKAELSFSLMYALENTVSGVNSFAFNSGTLGQGEANLTMSQWSLGAAYGWKF